MNRYQSEYSIAKTRVEYLETLKREVEHKYIEQNNIKNEDGTIPKRIYMIKDEDVFHKANEVVNENSVSSDLEAAKSKLRDAEDALIDYGLTICPASVVMTLRHACFGSYENADTRKKMIDLTFRLDTDTIKK